MPMTASDFLFADAVDNLLRGTLTPRDIRAIEHGGSPRALWQAMADAGFLELMADESDGGAALSLPAMFPILAAFGQHAVPVPLAQTVAARALLRHANGAMPAPLAMITLCAHARRLADGSLTLPMVAFGTVADHVIAGLDGELLWLDCAQAQRLPTGVHGSQIATLHWPAGNPASDSIVAIGEQADRDAAVARWSAAIHAAAMAGAMQRVFDMTLGYCNDRRQFGKAIGKFQAVQHQLSVMAEHVAAAGVAAELAFAGAGPVPAMLPVAMAKARTSAAAPLVAAIAHALHGAIGITEEYDLQLYTRRLHEWRMADGAESYWHAMLGRAILAGDGDGTIAGFVRAAMAPSRP
jgi:alkylation response protein AidB-like acyl-CoA dehydrogenase